MINFPFVLRSTYKKLQKELETVIKDNVQLRKDLAKARKNDGRDSKGRYSGSK